MDKNSITISKDDAYNLSQILLNYISSYCRSVPDAILLDDIELYNKLSGENLTLDNARTFIK